MPGNKSSTSPTAYMTRTIQQTNVTLSRQTIYPEKRNKPLNTSPKASPSLSRPGKSIAVKTSSKRYSKAALTSSGKPNKASALPTQTGGET
jgi:hypothetical protein